LVTRLCAFGQPVDFDLMPGSPTPMAQQAAPMVEAWTARFAGTPAPSVCASANPGRIGSVRHVQTAHAVLGRRV